jgi:hypothetical protein
VNNGDKPSIVFCQPRKNKNPQNKYKTKGKKKESRVNEEGTAGIEPAQWCQDPQSFCQPPLTQILKSQFPRALMLEHCLVHVTTTDTV